MAGVNLVGILAALVVLYYWFGEAIHESESGLYGENIDRSYRWSMSWFIFSEVMFFGAFFGALYWARLHSVPTLGDLDHMVLWPDFNRRTLLDAILDYQRRDRRFGKVTAS